MINKETIEAYFRKVEDDGWTFNRRGEKDNTWWYATYKGRSVKQEVYLVIDSKWVYFQLPFNHITINPDCKFALYEYLLRLNDRIFTAKFSIDENNKIVLMVEFSIRNFDFSMFNDALKTLVTFADQYLREIDILAQDVKVAAVITGKEMIYNEKNITQQVKIY